LLKEKNFLDLDLFSTSGSEGGGGGGSLGRGGTILSLKDWDIPSRPSLVPVEKV